VYMLENNKFIGLRPFVEGSIIKSPIFPELKVAVKDVFEDLA